MNREEVEYITTAPEVEFKEVHPSPSAGGGLTGKDLPSHGESSGKESNFIRCKQCGFILDRTKINPGNERGNDETSDITTNAGGTANSKDPDSTAGCPFCNASSYE